MFPSDYFARDYWPGAYWPPVTGGTPGPDTAPGQTWQLPMRLTAWRGAQRLAAWTGATRHAITTTTRATAWVGDTTERIWGWAPAPAPEDYS